MEIFESCQNVNDLLEEGNELAARNILIRLLDEVNRAEIPYPPVLNHFIRATGLFPYLNLDSASWDQRYVHQAFAVDVGQRTATLHREQSSVLSKLLSGADIAVSAPTSFGKSFIIDAFIAIRQPRTVVIIVPTIALMDETRRRIFKKFSKDYTIVTGPDAALSERNIFIFPQERSFSYIKRIDTIDLLVIDEFYKASSKHDKERSPSLIKAIIKLSAKADQRYYLAPNIKTLKDNVFTKGMEFIELLDFNTVYLEKHELFRDIDGDESKKSAALINLLNPRQEKSLIYAGTYAEIEKVSALLIAQLDKVERPHTSHFAKWLRENYQPNWPLAHLVERGIGVHNGRMHRCLSQLQVQIFEHEKGFDSIISTSSIIEGVNTSAQNVIIWRSKLGRYNLKDFTYKNIIGRGGRMFRHFVGRIYLLDAPPVEEDTQLEIEFPDAILGDLDEEQHRDSLTDLQIERIIEFKEEMAGLIGADNFSRIKRDNLLQDSDSQFLLRLARDMRYNPSEWKGFAYLNSDNPAHWDRMLYKIVGLKPGVWDTKWSKVVEVTKALSRNWQDTIPHILEKLQGHDVSINEFFLIERAITFKLAAVMNDANILYKTIIDKSVDITPFVTKISHAFLPRSVYDLEEFGLPRMLSKKINRSGFIDFSNPEMDVQNAIRSFQAIGLNRILTLAELTAFDKYIMRFFFHGITPDPESEEAEGR